MPRRPRLPLSMKVPLVLFVLALLLWVRTHFSSDALTLHHSTRYRNRGTAIAVSTAPDHYLLSRNTWHLSSLPPSQALRPAPAIGINRLSFSRESPQPLAFPAPPLFNFVGLSFTLPERHLTLSQTSTFSNTGWLLVVPAWVPPLLALVLASLPLLRKPPQQPTATSPDPSATTSPP